MMWLNKNNLAAPRGLQLVLAVLLVSAAMVLPSCIDAGEGFPDITSLSISPTSLSEFETANMTDQFFTIEMTVADFESEITEADVFIQLQGGDRVADKESFEQNGNTIAITGVRYSWFSNLEPGNYQVGATVVSSTGERVQALDLATVTITQE